MTSSSIELARRASSRRLAKSQACDYLRGVFRTNQPVTRNAFFDRAAELERLTALAEKLAAGHPTWLAILGARKIGKTSLLLELSRRNPTLAVRYVLIDVLEDAPVDQEFFRHYALRVVDAAYSSALGQSLEVLSRSPTEYSGLLSGAPGFGQLEPGLRRTLLGLPESEITPAFIRACLMLPEQLARALSTHFLVAIDEFQELVALRGRRSGLDPFSLMRSAWQKHERTAYVISGSGRSMLGELVTSKASPFFQHFDLLDLGPLPRLEAVRLLVEASPRERKIPQPVAERAVDLVGGHPFYLQLLGEAMTRGEPPYDENTLGGTLQEVLFSRAGRLALYFEREWQQMVGNSTFLARVLDELADGRKRLTEVAKAIGAQPGHASGYITRLGDAVEHHEDGTYGLRDPTFALWLRWRKPGGTVVPMTLVGTAAELRVAALLAKLGFELVYQSRGSRGAFDLLATRGAQQLGVQVKKTSLPVRFSKAEWSRMVADAARFGWLWLVAAVDDSDRVLLLDPAMAKKGQEVRLYERACIDNVLAWVDESVDPQPDPQKRSGRAP
ncbi:MAG: ATP-binding protein [Polyangiaceae bacterium]|nr:ATP-binding protein [Polyangiaceae bacterium]